MKWDETLEELLKAGSGRGSKMLTPSEAQQLLRVGSFIDLFLVSIEVYELRDGLEVPRLDLSLYNVCNEDEIVNLPLNSKKEACLNAFNELTAIIDNDEKSYGFRMWLED